MHSRKMMLTMAAALFFCLPCRAQNTPAANPFTQLHFRFLGPVGNRAAAIVGEPGNPLVVYIGAASGGIFKTADGGTNWKPVFDDQEVSAVGALAIAPSQHHVVWAGAGEPWLIRPYHAMGDGVYKSSDGGATWSHMGLEATGHIARIIVDPRNSDLVYVCAVGQAYRPQPERGIYKTTDGGKTWKQVLFVNENTGCSELSLDAHDPQTLFAGMWQVDIKTWKLNSGGPGGGVYISHDAGNTWKKLAGDGLPAADVAVGKTAVAIAPSNSQRVYALIEQQTPTLYKSDDGGKTWKIVNRNHIMAERAPYYTRFAVSPDNEDLLYFMSVTYSVSRDGGETFVRGVARPGGDNHDVWIDPSNANRVLVANDGGGAISLDRARSYSRVVLPIAQMYHVAVDNQVPYYVYGNRQDGPSFMAPSNNLEGPRGLFGGGITTGEWRSMGGCESGFGIPDPTDPAITWSGCYDGQLDRTDLRTGQSRSVMVWPDAGYGWTPAEVKYRWHWTFPIAISPHDRSRVYVGSQYVHETNDGGQTWRVISPDLTSNDKSHQQDSGGIAVDNLMTFDGAVLYAIAESPLAKGVIWTGSNDGQVQLTRDGGQHWSNVTRNLPNLPPWGTVANIEPSHFDPGAAYITLNLQQVGNYDPYVYKTADYGQSWKLISAGVPKSVSSFAHCVIEDPARQGMLYLGTDNALYVSWDDGGHWTRLRNNLPPAPVEWLAIQPQFNDLVIATYGRGFWILDDITPLRDWEKAQNADLHLFPARPAFRFRSKQDYRARDANGAVVGENPPYGADINFYLRQPAKQVEIAIVGPDGTPVRTLKKGEAEEPSEIEQLLGASRAPAITGEAGLNRVWWDLRSEPPQAITVRVTPPGEPWVPLGPQGHRRLEMWTTRTSAPRVAPGKYTVKLTADGKSMTQPLEVLRDPHSLGSEPELEEQLNFLRGLVNEINQAAEMVNHLEWTRLQLQQLNERLAGNAKAEAALKAAKELESKAIAAENQLVDVQLSGRHEDSFRHPMRLYGKMMALLTNLGETGADLPPTSQQVEVNKEFEQRLADARRSFDEVTQAGASLNQMLREGNFGQIEP